MVENTLQDLETISVLVSILYSSTKDADDKFVEYSNKRFAKIKTM